MALIKCPECGKEISDKATACPNCGCPIQSTEDPTPVVQRTAEEKPKKKSKAALIAVVAAIVLLGALCAAYFVFFSPGAKLRSTYNQAMAMYNDGKYVEALPIFEGLGEYNNSADVAVWCRYELAKEAIKKSEFQTAKEYLKEITYGNSADLLKNCDYHLGIQAMEAQDWEAAASIFDGLDYKESEELLTDCSFMIDLKDSILRRMEINAKERSDLAQLVNTELAYVEKYSKASFNDATLKKLAKKYIDGLKKQKDALTEMYQWDYQDEWYNGLVDRYDVLNRLYTEYGFLSDNKDFIGEYVNQYDYYKKWLAAFNELEAMMNKQYSTSDYGRQDYQYLYFTFTNTTKYTYTNQMDYWIYDYEGKTLLDTVSIITEDIRPGDSFTVKLYVGGYTNDWSLQQWGNWYPEIKIT